MRAGCVREAAQAERLEAAAAAGQAADVEAEAGRAAQPEGEPQPAAAAAIAAGDITEAGAPCLCCGRQPTSLQRGARCQLRGSQVRLCVITAVSRFAGPLVRSMAAQGNVHALHGNPRVVTCTRELALAATSERMPSSTGHLRQRRDAVRLQRGDAAEAEDAGEAPHGC